MEFVGKAIPLDHKDIIAEADQLGVEPATVWAVCQVESTGGGFLGDHRPKILFEAHAFHVLTKGRYDRAYPNISSPVWDRSLYGHSGAHQYDRLAIAIGLDRPEGLESASWGRFQLMGFNFNACGYADIESFVADMMDDEFAHLVAFVRFCRSSNIVKYLVSHDWARFALHYNGSGQVPYYAQKLADAYKDYPGDQSAPGGTSSPAAPVAVLSQGDQGDAVRALQEALNRNGYAVRVDGLFGLSVKAAVKKFQTKSGLLADGIVGPLTRTRLGI